MEKSMDIREEFEINYENGLSVHIGRPLIWDKKSI
jgi:hypothetical protein